MPFPVARAALSRARSQRLEDPSGEEITGSYQVADFRSATPGRLPCRPYRADPQRSACRAAAEFGPRFFIAVAHLMFAPASIPLSFLASELLYFLASRLLSF